jgi:hypothetical protein
MDKSSLASLVALGIGIIVILTVQMLVVASLAAHLFLRHHEQRSDEEKIRTKRSRELQLRNTSAPVAATRIIPHTGITQHQHCNTTADTEIQHALYCQPGVPFLLRPRIVTPPLPPRPQNPTPEHRLARDPEMSVKSSVYSQEYSHEYDAGHEDPTGEEQRHNVESDLHDPSVPCNHVGLRPSM